MTERGPLLAASRRRPKRRVVEGVVDWVDGRAGRDDLVDPVQHRLVEDDVGGGELALELLHRARADDRGGDRGVVEDEGDRELDQRDAGLVGELGELLDGVELALVGGRREVEALGQPLAREEDCWPASLRQRPDSQPPVSGL